MVLSRVAPALDAGLVPVKRVLGDVLRIEVDLLVDGHTKVAGVAKVRANATNSFFEIPLLASGAGSDRHYAEVALDSLGRWQFTVEGWVDAFSTWRWAFERKVDAGQDVAVELASGVALISAALARAPSALLSATLAALHDAATEKRAQLILDPEVARAMAVAPDRQHATRHATIFEVVVEPVRARFSAWYELFVRSTGQRGQHGTFKDATAWLPYIAELGFDVLYLPPIHPIGTTARKGPNNSLVCRPGDPGSPWAIGNHDGGHKAIHSELGTAEDFRAFVLDARRLGIEVALDIAFQASPDHPYVSAHPDWFIHRSDGTIQSAENPPKKYQDVYPLNFECDDWQALWLELKSVFDHWISQGVRIFRVDNPHTKPLPFWVWCLAAIKNQHPDIVFLAEAFTRPPLMQALAKAGFSQSYTYFTWRNGKRELTDYLQELVGTELVEYLRPNFWPTTPDIFPELLQIGGRAAFIARLILAGTLSSSYGIHGPAYELLEHIPRLSTEELLDSEKYQLRHWDLDRADSLRDVITRLNRIRREQAALHDNRSLRFLPTDNERVLCYTKAGAGHDVVLVVVNLDPNHTQAAWIEVDFDGMPDDQSFQVHDLLSDARYLWRGRRNFVELDPAVMPAHIFVIRRLARREQEFEYYL